MIVENLKQNWQLQLELDCPKQSAATRESIVLWLIGDDVERFDALDNSQIEILKQGMAYRYRILRQRYLGVAPEQAYCHLMKRLGSLLVLSNKICAWINHSPNPTSTVLDVLQEVIQDLLQSDRYMQQQMTWIAKCTHDLRLRNALLFATTEEYCLRPIRNQPLVLYRLINYMRRTGRGGITQVPKSNSLQLLYEISIGDSEGRVNLLYTEAFAQYQQTQAIIEQQMLRNAVQQEFSHYLAETLGPLAVQWLELYLQGQSQKAIASRLNLSVKKVYRLREKISYHAVQIFARTCQPELVSSCLQA